MPGRIFTEAERARLNDFPTEIAPDDIVEYFTFSDYDMEQIKTCRRDPNKLGYGLQLGTLRYMGFCPDNLIDVPVSLLKYIARQIEVSQPTELLKIYADREQTRTEHLLDIQDYLGYRRATPIDMEILLKWLMERALEHDKPLLLFHLACEHLRSEKIIRPGITSLERIVITSRQEANKITYDLISSLLTEEIKELLDKILIFDKETGKTPLEWLRYGATTNSSNSILETIKKLLFLSNFNVENWDISCINPNRRKFLAQLGVVSGYV